jgi:sodium transport system permease protein
MTRDDSGPSRSSGFGLARTARLAMKELKETLRDRRTIVTLVLMPVLVYPLLSMALQRFLLPAVPRAAPSAPVVALQRPDDFAILAEYIPDLNSNQFRLADDVANAVTDGSAAIGVRIETRKNAHPRFELVHRPDAESRAAAAELEARLRRTLMESVRSPRMAQLLNLEIAYTRLTPTADKAPSPLATLVPLILILMTITGAVYPAIDLTAGERERGTLETLIAAPVSRLSLLLAKYVAVVTVALLTASVNLTAMTITMQLSGVGSLLFGDDGLSLSIVVRVFGLLILFAAFFSAVLLSITAVARSFKEAQAYLIPVMLVAIAPGLLSMAPGMELTPGLAAVPLVNLVLVARDTFLGHANPQLAAIGVLTTCFYALAAIGFATRVFGTDAILYGSHRSWSDLLQRPLRPADAATPGTALLCIALVFPGQFLLSSLIARAPGLSMTLRLTAAGLATIVLFVLPPALLAVTGRVRWQSALRWKPVPPVSWLAALLLGASLWPLAHQAFQIGRQAGLAALTTDQLQQVGELLSEFRRLPLALIIVALGVIPGICEELFFRGFLFAGFRRKLNPAATILVTSLLFAAFHLVTPSMLAVERFLPTLLLGLALGTVAARTGSVLPGMLVHIVHNSLLLSLTRLYQSDDAMKLEDLDLAQLPWPWFVQSAAGIALAGLLFLWSSRAATRKPEVNWES